MVSQGFFSGSEKRSKRLAGQKENKVALGGDNLGSFGGVGAVIGVGALGIKGIQSAIEGGKRLKENIEKRVNPERETSFFSPRGNEVARVASSDLSNLRVGSPEVRIANVKSYTDSSTKPYSPKDSVYDAINKYDVRKEKSDYQKKIEERNRIAESFGVNPETGPTYTVRDESKFGGELLKSPFPGVKDRYITTKERISGITDPRFGKESGFTVTPKKFDKGTAFQIGVQFDQNKYGLTPSKVLGVDIGGMYNFKDKEYGESTKAFVAGMMQNAENAMQTEVRLKKEQEAAKEQAKIDAANARFEKISQDFLNDPAYKERLKKFNESESESPVKDETSTVDKVFGFLDTLGKVKYVGSDATNQESTTEDTRKLGTMPSMGISEAGREEAKLNRLQKAKEEGENKNILQRVGDAVGNVFNKITGTDAAGASTLQSQGINTGATVNLSQIGNVSPTVQAARDAVAKANLRKSGLDKTIGGQSSQANYGRASRGFGTGTHGKGMKSNPGSQRQTGVGKSAGNLSRHKAGHSSSQPSSSRSRSQGRGGRRGGSTGGSGSSSKGGTGKGQSRSGGTTGRKASKASRSRTGRSRSQCDIRTKIDISPLINSNLVKDNLAEVAYFVQEIKK